MRGEGGLGLGIEKLPTEFSKKARAVLLLHRRIPKLFCFLESVVLLLRHLLLTLPHQQ